MGQEYVKNVTVSSTIPTFSEPVFFDDFEGVFGWSQLYKQNATGSFGKNATDVYQGSNALRLINGTVTPLAGQKIGVVRYLGGTDRRYIVYNGFFRPSDGDSTQIISFYLDSHRTDKANEYILQCNIDQQIIQVQTTGGTFTTINTDPYLPDFDGWNFFKMIIDAQTGYYVKAQINSKVFDIRTIPGRNQTENEIENLLIGLYAQHTINAQGTYYFDNISVLGADNV
jgi:hypothetical protein